LGTSFLAVREVDFQTRDRRAAQPIVGGFSLLRVTIPRHYPHFFKISEMKPISKSQLPIEIYTFQEIMSTDQLLAPGRNRHRAVILALPRDKNAC
jgi:hypothetical protein